MEYVDMDLEKIMKSKTNFTESHLIRIIYNILCSIAFLHEANVIHRDLKPANILITPNCDAKICDFGLSRTMPQNLMDSDGFNSLYLKDKLL